MLNCGDRVQIVDTGSLYFEDFGTVTEVIPNKVTVWIDNRYDIFKTYSSGLLRKVSRKDYLLYKLGKTYNE